MVDIDILFFNLSLTKRSVKNVSKDSYSKQHNKEEKKDLILRTALKVFAQEGYHASSVNKIANKANISKKGLIYNYFESKEDLLRNIMTNIMDRYMDKYPPIGSIPDDSHIEYFIDQSFEFILEDKARAKLFPLCHPNQ